MVKRIAELARIWEQFQVGTLYVFGSRATEVCEWYEGARPDLLPGPADVDVGRGRPPSPPWVWMESGW